jgi:hypothetical protein
VIPGRIGSTSALGGEGKGAWHVFTMDERRVVSPGVPEGETMLVLCREYFSQGLKPAPQAR